MAIIYSYPKVTTPLDTDVLVLTDTTLTAGKRKNKTKSLAMSDLAAYVASSTSGITGSGTFNTIPLWTPDGTKLGDSIITQDALGQGVIISGTLNVTGNTTFLSTITAGGGTGTAGQVLSSTGTGVAWIAGDTNTTYDLTGAVSNVNDYKVVLTGSDGTIDNVNFEAGNGISLVDQGTNTVSINAINNGTVTGTGITNTLPLWSDGPSGVLGDSIITQAAAGQGVTVTGGLDVTQDFSVAGSTELFSTLEVQEASTFSDVSFQGAVFDGGGNPGTAGQVLSSTGTQTEWVDSSAAITKLVPYFQIATPGGSDTYTQSNNIVDFDWSGGSGTYEYILPSATAIPYRTIRFVNNSTITASDKIHITAPGTETIDGVAFYSINKPYNGCAVWSDGVQWIVIQAKA